MDLKPQNFEPLLAWLDAGCPYVAFNLKVVSTRMEEVDPLEMVWSSTPMDCGSVCCIAGYIYQNLTGSTDYRRWEDVEELAAHHLGLERDGLFLDCSRYSLFDPDKAPDDCTPSEAAAAVRRVLKGEAPWT